MSISISGDPVNVKSIGEINIIKNKKRHHKAAFKYNHIKIRNPDNILPIDKYSSFLFTNHQIKRAKKRAIKNPEDLPESSILSDLFYNFLFKDAISDMQKIQNQKATKREAKEYNHIMVNFKGENTHLLFTDNEMKIAKQRANKNPEDIIDIDGYIQTDINI